jgi:hypothetical protein
VNSTGLGDIPSGPELDKSQVQERQRQLALRFRSCMTETEQPQFEETNEYRTSFFTDVTAKANKVGSMDILLPCEDESVS